jgi:hypothetical protein
MKSEQAADCSVGIGKDTNVSRDFQLTSEFKTQPGLFHRILLPLKLRQLRQDAKYE